MVSRAAQGFMQKEELSLGSGIKPAINITNMLQYIQPALFIEVNRKKCKK